MKPLIINLLFLTLTIVSCSRNSNETETIAPIEKTSYNFVYNNSYETKDIVLYKGPLGVKQNPTQKFIADIWNSYSIPEYTQIDVDTKGKTIRLHVGKNIVENQIELSNDSIYIPKDKVFLGVLDKKNERLRLFKSFYYIKKHLESSGTSFSRFTKLGITKSEDIFGINTFNSPSEMTDPNDEIFWANLSFIYTSN